MGTRPLHSEINSRLSALHPGHDDDDYFLCVHQFADVSAYSRNSAVGLSDSRWSHKAPYHHRLHHHYPRQYLQSTIRISLTTADAIFHVSSLMYIYTYVLYNTHSFSSIMSPFSCPFEHNRVSRIRRASSSVDSHESKI